MAREEFKKELDEKCYKWREEGEWIIVEEPYALYLNSMLSIPDNVQFNNEGYVDLDSLKSMGDNVQFRNGGNVNLRSMKSIGNNIKFNNGGDVYLRSLESIPGNIQFNNLGCVGLGSLESIPDNVQFNNGGNVFFDSLKSIPINVDHREMFPSCKDIRIKFKWLDIEKNRFTDSRWKSIYGRVQMYESWVKNNY